MDLREDRPFYTPPGIGGMVGGWARHVVEGSFKIWDLAKPVIAQVSGYCLAGGLELAHSCDLIYTTPDAKFGYPAVRMISTADNNFFPWDIGPRRAMELMRESEELLLLHSCSQLINGSTRRAHLTAHATIARSGKCSRK